MITELKEKAMPYVVGAVIWLASVWVLGLSIAENTVSALESNPAEEQFPFKIESNTRFCEEEIEQELNNIRLWIQNREWFYHLIAGNCTFDEEWVSRAEQNKEWQPWKLTADGSRQEMPEISGETSHERFKELCEAYWLPASLIREVENRYNIREGVILWIIVAETSGWKFGYGVEWCHNIWNVWNNDRWDRYCYDSFEVWLEKIAQALNNSMLWTTQTLWCLSRAGSCKWWEDKGYIYASSDWNWERNMLQVLNTIYKNELGEINPERFNVRRAFTIYQ